MTDRLRSVPELTVLGERLVSQRVLVPTRCDREHRASGVKSEWGKRGFGGIIVPLTFEFGLEK